MKQKIKQIFYWIFNLVVSIIFWPLLVCLWFFDNPKDEILFFFTSITSSVLWFLLLSVIIGAIIK